MLHHFRDIAGFCFCAHKPTHISPYFVFWGVSRWTRSPLLGSMCMSRYLKLFGREIIFAVFQPVWMWQSYQNVTDRDDLLWHQCALCSIMR